MNFYFYVPNFIQFHSVAQSCPTLCNPMNRSTPGLPVHHRLPEFTQTHVHWVGDAIQPSHLCRPLLLHLVPPRISPSWTPLPPPSPYHPSGSSPCTSPKHPVSCIESGLAIRFLYDIIQVSMPFSQVIPPSPSPTESKKKSGYSKKHLTSPLLGLG